MAKAKASKLRDMFKQDRFIRIVGAHDGLTAKLVEKHNFEGVWASGLEIATSHGVPDADILTMNDHLQRSIEMNDIVSIPVIADCDTGYGNSNNVIHMVKKFEAAGIAAVCIEDKKFPKVNSLLKDGRQELSSIAEFVGKIMAAKNAQQSKDFMVFARIEALIAGWGIEEALKRAQFYIDAGADAIFIHSKSKKPTEIIDFCKRFEGEVPLVLCPTTYSSLTEGDMKNLGVNMVIYANHGIRASISAINEVFSCISKEGIINIDSRIATMEDVFELQGMHIMKEEEEKYLRVDDRDNVKALILAAGIPPEEKLRQVLKETPLVMLDINGKTILQRNVETLNRAGIRKINVVTGYQAEKVDVDGINRVYNKDYEKKGILHSIITAEKYLNGKMLLSFGDIIFDDILIEKLLKARGDIILVIDGSYKTSNYRNKKLDLIIAKNDPISGPRKIDIQRDNPVLCIGKDIDEKKANFEFIGLCLLSEKGIEDFKKAYHMAKKKYAHGKFQGMGSFDKAGLIDLIQEMIKSDYKIGSLEVNSGWSEVHSFDDYRRISRLLVE